VTRRKLKAIPSFMKAADPGGKEANNCHYRCDRRDKLKFFHAKKMLKMKGQRYSFFSRTGSSE
jgi:hypothetical protein